MSVFFFFFLNYLLFSGRTRTATRTAAITGGKTAATLRVKLERRPKDREKIPSQLIHL